MRAAPSERLRIGGARTSRLNSARFAASSSVSGFDAKRLRKPPRISFVAPAISVDWAGCQIRGFSGQNEVQALASTRTDRRNCAFLYTEMLGKFVVGDKGAAPKGENGTAGVR